MKICIFRSHRGLLLPTE